MVTGLIFCYFPSTVSFSVTDGPICGLDSHNKISWHKDDLRMYYCCKGGINSRVLGIVNWCDRPKSRQSAGKLMVPS